MHLYYNFILLLCCNLLKIELNCIVRWESKIVNSYFMNFLEITRERPPYFQRKTNSFLTKRRHSIIGSLIGAISSKKVAEESIG